MVEFELNHPGSRISVILVAVALAGVLGYLIIAQFAVNTLADQDLNFSRQTIETAAGYFSSSAKLQTRLAATIMAEPERDIAAAESAALRAVALSPWDYQPRLVLATVLESKGDRAGAEKYLRLAFIRAPRNTDVQWRLGNLFLREANLTAATPQFHAAVLADPSLLPSALDLLWQVTGGDQRVLEEVAGNSARNRLTLAQFLLDHDEGLASSQIFAAIPKSERVQFVESSQYIDALISRDYFEAARQLWLGLVSDAQHTQAPLIWNSGFELDLHPPLIQFDWLIGASEYARLSVDGGTGHTGTRSLRIDFLGRDTSRLDNEIRELVLVRPDTTYSLEYFVRTEGLLTPEGPRVTVTSSEAPGWTAMSPPVPEGSADWTRQSFEFTTPPKVRTVTLSIKRIPKFSYDDPTNGTVWFDDFVMK